MSGMGPGSIGGLPPAGADNQMLVTSGGTWIQVPTSSIPGFSPRAFMRFTRETAVAGAGTLYLRTGEGIVTSVIGDNLPAGGNLKGISYVVNALDAARTYNIEVFRVPTLVTIPGATLAVPLSTKSDRRRDLNIALAAIDEIGVRIVRATGAGGSTFTNINVVLEIEVP